MTLIKLVLLLGLFGQTLLLVLLVWTPETDKNAERFINRIRGRGGRQ